ncbi:hypothetical protein NOCARDAX2BIS_270040 [Nocardioides sp. AX2bis]|nr:hypothetical protein NOCARDAX2BIS_270040 [Nocardioides sp. AX2bis]
MIPARFPHSDTPGSQLGCQLPRAYRRLQRPSSALDAKASTMCPLQLANTNTQQKQQRHKLTLQYENITTTHKPASTNVEYLCGFDARVHYPIIKHHGGNQPAPLHQGGADQQLRVRGVMPQNPNSVPCLHPHTGAGEHR